MKVQKAVRSDTNQVTWLVLDDAYRPITPIQQFLHFLDATGKSPNTVRAYAYHLKLYWSYLGAIALPWAEIKLAHLADFLYWLQRGDTPGVISLESQTAQRTERTINLILTAVAMFYDYHARNDTGPALALWRERRGGPTPFKSLLHHISKRRPTRVQLLKLKEPQRQRTILTAEQVDSLIVACARKRDQLLLTLLYETGMRIGQALGLRHADIHSWDNEIHITPREDNANGMRAKSDSVTVVHVGTSLMALYTDYLIEEYGDIDSDYVFINLWAGERGEPMSYSAVITLFRRLSQRTGIDVRPHLLRHTHATELIQAGWDLAHVQKRLGHRHVQTTINTYSHLTDTDLKRAYRKYLTQRENSDDSS